MVHLIRNMIYYLSLIFKMVLIISIVIISIVEHSLEQYGERKIKVK